MSTPACRACGASLSVGEPIPRDAECPGCGHDVRCCVNCRHYDPRYHNACRETEADPVADKHHRNFCEYFHLSREPVAADGSGARAADARARLEQLFGGRSGTAAGAPDTSTPEDEARRKLRKLRELFEKGEDK